MNFFNLFKRGGSAPVARDRLQILLAHERSVPGSSDLLTILRHEILAAAVRPRAGIMSQGRPECA